MAKITFEQGKCIGCGACASICPKYFEISGNGKSVFLNSIKNQKSGNFELEVKDPECIKDAAEACPVQIIHIIK